MTETEKILDDLQIIAGHYWWPREFIAPAQNAVDHINKLEANNQKWKNKALLHEDVSTARRDMILDLKKEIQERGKIRDAQQKTIRILEKRLEDAGIVIDRLKTNAHKKIAGIWDQPWNNNPPFPTSLGLLGTPYQESPSAGLHQLFKNLGLKDSDLIIKKTWFSSPKHWNTFGGW